MAKYGNILAVFNADQPTINSVETILKDHKTNFVVCEGLYFVETNSKKNTTDVTSALNILGVDFVLFHNNISDGSLIKSNGIDNLTVNKINKILFK
jgi:hypothetical protein